MNNIYKRKLSTVISNNNFVKKFKQDNCSKNVTNTLYKNKNKNKKNKLNIHKSIVSIDIDKRKDSIPKRIREMVWNTHNGEKYTSKCYVTWCNNYINVFNYQVGHDIPESKGGTMDLDNLKPICGNCNQSMGNKYTIQEWCKLLEMQRPSSTSNDMPSTNTISNIEDGLVSENDELKKFIKTYLDKNTSKNPNINTPYTNTSKLSLIAVLVLALNIILFYTFA